MTEECKAQPTSTSAEDDETAAADKRCAHCGGQIETSEWYPVATERDADGSLQLYQFCSAGCQDDWRRDRSE